MKNPQDNSKPAGENQHKLVESTGIFTSKQIKLLQDHWIETVEQVLSTASTDEGKEGLAKLLEVDKGTLEGILDNLSRTLPLETLEEVSKSEPERPRGVIFPEQQERQTGSNDEGEDR